MVNVGGPPGAGKTALLQAVIDARVKHDSGWNEDPYAISFGKRPFFLVTAPTNN